MNILQMKSEMKGLLLQAKALAELASREHRGFTDVEQAAVDAHIQAAETLKRRIEQAESDPAEVERQKDQALRDAINAFDNDISNDWKAAASWGADFRRGLPYQPSLGRKEFLPTSGSVVVGSLLPQIGTLADDVRAESFLQFIRKETTEGDVCPYLRETVRTHAAAAVGIGEVKPTSTYTLERVEGAVRTIAHLSEPIARQWLADAKTLDRYIASTMREGLLLELERQVLLGGALAADLDGMLLAPGVQTVAFVTNVLTTTRRAITALENLPIVATGWAIHPDDWETIELSASTTGEFLVQNATRLVPVDRVQRRLWGLPVAVSVSVPSGIGVLAAWDTAVTLVERQGVEFTWSDAFRVAGGTSVQPDDSTGFETNQVKMRCEGRYCLCINRPAGIVEVDLLAGS